MNLWEIQTWVAGLIRANSTISAAGAGAGPNGLVIPDDGTYPKTHGREALLNGKGLSFIVWKIECAGLHDSSASGVCVPEIYVPIVIEENVTVNRATGGTHIVEEQAVQLVLQSCLGKRPSAVSNEMLRAYDPPWESVGVVNGVHRTVVNLGLKTTITPA